MKTKMMRKWTIVLGFLASVCLFFACLMTNPIKANADTEEPAQTVTLTEVTGFEMVKGARARIADGDGGIRFDVNVSADAYAEMQEMGGEGAKITFYTLMARTDKVALADLTMENATANNAYIIKNKASVQPNGVSVFEYRTTYLTSDFNNYTKKLIARGVAEIVDAEGVKQYVYAKMNDNERSMQQVAYSAITDTSATAPTTDKGLTRYFAAQDATTKSYIEQVKASTTLALDLPTAEGETVVAAFTKATENENGKKLAVGLTDGVTLNVSDFSELALGATTELTLYTDKNNAYTVSVMNITQGLRTAQDLSIFNLKDKDVEGYYLVMNDIDASAVSANAHEDLTNNTDSAQGGIDWDFDYAFKGTFDGNGKTVTANTNKGGLFGNLKGATVTNTNFVLNFSGERKLNTDKWPAGLAYSAAGGTAISNVYAELNCGTGLTAASGRDWGLSLIVNILDSNSYGYVKTENIVVVNNDDFTNLTVNTARYATGALFYADSARHRDRDSYMSNVFVIAPKTFGNDNSGYVAMASGTHLSTFASNDTDSKNAVDSLLANNTFYQYKNATRYDSVAEFVKSFAWENTIPDFIMQNLLKNGVTAYVGETAVANDSISVPLNVAQTVTLKIGERVLTDVELTSNVGEEIVTINDDTFTLLSAGNVAEITATGKLGDMSVMVTFTVSIDATTYDKEVLFSGMDGDVDTVTIFGDGAVLANAYGEDGTAYTVADGKITNLTNTTNAPIEKTLLLGTSDNQWKYVTFNVYTKLLDSSDDLAVFSLTKDTVENITGCYLVIKDIDASAVTANAHTDIREGDWNFNYAFEGVFDGGGHTIKANVDKGGLFGNLQNATITNVNFVFNVTGSMRANTDKFPSGLAYGVVGNQATTTISNVYAELNPTTGLTAASQREWALSLIVTTAKSVKLNNVVVVNNDDFANLKASSAGWVAGALINFHSGRTDTGYTNAHITNVFVIAPEMLGVADVDGEGNPSTYYGYYVPMSGRTTSQAFASNDTTGKADAATKTGVTQYTYANVWRYSTLKDFVNAENTAKDNIPDFIKNAVNAQITTSQQ